MVLTHGQWGSWGPPGHAEPALPWPAAGLTEWGSAPHHRLRRRWLPTAAPPG